jgi:hypothetical protein
MAPGKRGLFRRSWFWKKRMTPPWSHDHRTSPSWWIRPEALAATCSRSAGSIGCLREPSFCRITDRPEGNVGFNSNSPLTCQRARLRWNARQGCPRSACPQGLAMVAKSRAKECTMRWQGRVSAASRGRMAIEGSGCEGKCGPRSSVERETRSPSFSIVSPTTGGCRT